MAEPHRPLACFHVHANQRGAVMSNNARTNQAENKSEDDDLWAWRIIGLIFVLGALAVLLLSLAIK
jgi:hypothetical protein